MENQLFSWEGWDQQDTMAFSFSDVVLKKAIGQFPIGMKFDFAHLDYGEACLQLGNYGPEKGGCARVKEHYDFKLTLSVA